MYWTGDLSFKVSEINSRVPPDRRSSAVFRRTVWALQSRERLLVLLIPFLYGSVEEKRRDGARAERSAAVQVVGKHFRGDPGKRLSAETALSDTADRRIFSAQIRDNIAFCDQQFRAVFRGQFRKDPEHQMQNAAAALRIQGGDPVAAEQSSQIRPDLLFRIKRQVVAQFRSAFPDRRNEAGLPI